MTGATTGLLAAGLLLAGCGGSTATGPRALPREPQSSPPVKCCVAGPSPHLALHLSARRGPAGTLVLIRATGCEDPAGDNHAVSFNNDAEDVSARNDPNTVRTVTSTRHGTTLTASYRIVDTDRTGGVGMFFVQCGQTLAQQWFRVTS